MLKFLTTMILALIIFVPACIFVSRIFTLSDQAKGSYTDFTDSVIDFSQKGEGSDSTLLIMDVGSSVFLYTSEETMPVYTNEYISKGKGATPAQRQRSKKKVEDSYLFDYPKSECGSTPCFCLCRAFDEDGATRTNQIEENDVKKNTYNLQCRSLTCQPLPSDLKINSFSYHRSEKDPRRSVINLNKEDGVVSLSVQ